MAIEGKDAAESMPAHESEGSAVCETDLLIGEPGEQVERRQFVFRVGPQDRECLRAEECPGALRREGVRRLSAQESEGLVENEVAGEAGGPEVLDLGPDSPRPGMVAVAPHVAGDEGSRVDEDHFLSYRYLSCFADRSRGAGRSKMTSSNSGS